MLEVQLDEDVNMRDLVHGLREHWKQPESINMALEVLEHIDVATEQHNGVSGIQAIKTILEASREWTGQQAEAYKSTLHEVLRAYDSDVVEEGEADDVQEIDEEE